MEPITLTIAGVVTALVIEASKETGKGLVKGSAELMDRLVSLVRNRFKSAKVEGVLTQLQEEPTETNKTIFSALLVRELSKNEDFANEIAELLKQLKVEGNKAIQSALVGIEVKGHLEVGDVIQKSSGQSAVTQKVAENIKGKSVKIGNITQEN